VFGGKSKKRKRLAKNGGITEGTSQEIVHDAAQVFGGKSKKRKIGNHSNDTNSVSPLVGRAAGPGHPQQHRIRCLQEPPAPSEKRKASCAFCGSTMKSSSAHCKINTCPRVKALGILLKDDNRNDFAEKLLNGTFPADADISQEDGLRLRANILTSLPISAKFICVHRQFTVSQGFAHEFLHLASNRAAEVTMYGEGGVVLEEYNGVAATVTGVSVWVNRNKNNHVISAMDNPH
jgi:hypothetical protein